MRKTRSSSNAAWTVRLSACADARSVPNGFSMITQASVANPVVPSISMMEPNATGGMARW